MNSLRAAFRVDFKNFDLDVDLALPESGVTVLFGPSGSGKTTLLRCVAGLARSPSGFLKMGETVWQDESKGVFVPPQSRPLAMVFQEHRLFSHLSVRSNLLYGWRRTAPELRRVDLERVVDLLELGPLLERRPRSLSGGEGQRVAIGRALLRSPRFLLMDEPLASLDAVRKREILPYIRRLQRELKIPILYVSHSIAEVLQLVDTMVLLKAGRVAALGPVEEVFARIGLRNDLDSALVGAVIDTQIQAHEPEYGLTRLRFQEQTLYAPRQPGEAGDTIRLHIHANDVSLALSPPDAASSVLNVLKAKVLEVGPAVPERPSVDIRLDVGQPILASITRKSLDRLHLTPGQTVYAQIKALRTVHEMDDTVGE